MAAMVKSTYCLLDLQKLDGSETECNNLVIKAAANRATTVASPPAFRDWLFRGVETGEITFTNATDAALVSDIYAAAFRVEFTRVVEMRYDQTGMRDKDACALGEAIVFARDLGVLQSLELLDLSFNQIGDTGCAAIARALSGGAMPKLKSLRLRGNSIGDKGIAALADALASVTLHETHGSLADIRISGNPASEGALQAVQAATPAVVL